MNILVANIGSTSFKYRLFGMEAGQGTRSGPGRAHRTPGRRLPGLRNRDRPLWRRDRGRRAGRWAGLSELTAIGFKAVHAGPISGARLVDDRVLAAMEEYSFFAPAHNPPYIAAMRSFREGAAGRAPGGAVRDGVLRPRRRGRHHLRGAVRVEEKNWAYAATASTAPATARRANGRRRCWAARDLRHISCHLGGSSSLAAIRNGVAVETSFGMSPQSGLPHNNRVGDLDVFAALFVMKKRGLDGGPDGGDPRRASPASPASAGPAATCATLEARLPRPEAPARTWPSTSSSTPIRHYLGAFLVELGGLDVLTFSGGIGENSAEIRAGVCAGLEEFGIVLDARPESARAHGEGCHSPLLARGCQGAVIVPADEERSWRGPTADGRDIGTRYAAGGSPPWLGIITGSPVNRAIVEEIVREVVLKRLGEAPG